MAPSSRPRSGNGPIYRSSSSSLRAGNSNSSNSLRRQVLSNATFNYGNRDEAAIISDSSIRHTASAPSLRSSPGSSRSSSSRPAHKFQFQADNDDSSSRTTRDSNVIRHTTTTTVGSSGNTYRVAVVEPAGSSSNTWSSRFSGETVVASSRAPDSIRSYGSSAAFSRRAGGDDRLLMPPPSCRDGNSRDGGLGSSRNCGSGSRSLRR